MTDKQPDAEAIAALEAYYGVDDSWKGSERDGFIAGMRRALDAADAHCRAQSPSGLVDDCARIVESLKPFGEMMNFIDEHIAPCDVIENHELGGVSVSMVRNCRAALSLAESLPGKIEALEAERDDALKRADYFERQCALETQDASDQEGLKFVAEFQLAAREAEVARLVKGLGLALARLIKYEPGDSRAVSDEFVAMSVLEARLEDYDNAMTIIEAKLTAIAALVAEKEEG